MPGQEKSVGFGVEAHLVRFLTIMKDVQLINFKIKHHLALEGLKNSFASRAYDLDEELLEKMNEDVPDFFIIAAKKKKPNSKAYFIKKDGKLEAWRETSFPSGKKQVRVTVSRLDSTVMSFYWYLFLMNPEDKNYKIVQYDDSLMSQVLKSL